MFYEHYSDSFAVTHVYFLRILRANTVCSTQNISQLHGTLYMGHNTTGQLSRDQAWIK